MMAFQVLEAHTRPALKGECFYCHEKVGENHLDDCVYICKKVRVKCVVEYEITCPAFWTKERIEYHRNEGSWCSDNFINELAIVSEKEGCLCHSTVFEVIDMMDGEKPFIDEEGKE